MRILHIAKYYPPDRGGMESFVQALAERQAAQGHEVHILAHAGTAQAGQQQLAPRLHIQRCTVLFTAGRYAPVAPAMAWHYWRRVRSAQPPDIVHVHCPNVAGLLPALPRMLYGFQPPLVVHWHADVEFPVGRKPSSLLLSLWKHLERCLLRRADAIIATSTPYLHSSTALAPFRAKCRVIPLGLENCGPDPKPLMAAPLAFLTQPQHIHSCNFLAVGRLSHYKGFGVLLKALALVGEVSGKPELAQKVRLCMVGDGEEMPLLKALVEQYALHDRVLLAGQVDDATLAACLKQCSALCLPSTSRQEAFGMVLLEAMRAAKPCIASAVTGSGMTELVQHEVTGLLVPPDDAPALARAMAHLAETFASVPDGAAHPWGLQGQARFAKHYTMEHCNTLTEELYAEILHP